MSPLNISFYTPISIEFGGGGEKWLARVASFLLTRGHTVRIYALPYAPGGKRRVKRINILPEGVKYRESWFHRIEGDVVYVVYAPFVRFLFRFRGPIIAGIHSGLFLSEKPPKLSYGVVPIVAWVTFHIFGKNDLSKYSLIHAINQKTNLYTENVKYIPNFVDTYIFAPKETKKERFTVLFSGRPSWVKGYDIFLEIASNILKITNEIDFVAVGATDSHIDNVISVPYVSDEIELAKIYSSAHLTLVPSRSENFPLTILESLSCGTEVLTSKIDNIVSLKLPVHYAETANEFVSKIISLYTEWNLSKSTSVDKKNSLIKSVRGYSFDEISKEFELLFDQAYAANNFSSLDSLNE